AGRHRRTHVRPRRDDARPHAPGARRGARHSSARDSSDRRIARERLLLPRRSMSAFLNPTVMWLTWRQLFARRRLWFALAFALTPALFTLVFLVVADDGNSSRAGFYQGMLREVVLGTIL